MPFARTHHHEHLHTSCQGGGGGVGGGASLWQSALGDNLAIRAQHKHLPVNTPVANISLPQTCITQAQNYRGEVLILELKFLPLLKPLSNTHTHTRTHRETAAPTHSMKNMATTLLGIISWEDEARYRTSPP